MGKNWLPHSGEKFQFLMVRLKVTGQVNATEFKLFQFLMVRLKESTTTFQEGLHIFQFLMVRLKGPLPTRHKWLCRISIPYGSIKSDLDVLNP